jgi:hypothetical protein
MSDTKDKTSCEGFPERRLHEKSRWLFRRKIGKKNKK